MRHVFIVNPAAGKGRSSALIGSIENRFRRFPEPYHIEITNHPGHATDIAKRLSAEGTPMRVYSVGGDGTLNEIINGVSGQHIELGIIPCGSGNDAIRSIYNITDPHVLLKILPVASSTLLDMGKINGRYFINIASIGFDAEVVTLSRKFKRIPPVSGSMAYILGVLTAVIGLKKHKVRITIDDGSERTNELLLCAFANGKFYGGGMKAAPQADMTDGILDICEVEKPGRIRLLKLFPAFMRGEHTGLKEVTLHRCRKIEIVGTRPLPINFDGEITEDTRVTVEIVPGSLRVLIP
ncbi:MAG: diacylglycerol kinase family lipid kinase [Clostridiaceae bacterium]|nr:diacylglycerol kinase family lipid kinase [Clostridiaceae bacterium]